MFRLHTEDGDVHDFTDALEMFEFVSERIDNEHYCIAAQRTASLRCAAQHNATIEGELNVRQQP